MAGQKLAPAGRLARAFEQGWRDTMMNKLSLRLRLPLLVAGTMLPLILFAAGLVYVNHVRNRDGAFDRVLETVKGIQTVLDTEMQGITL